MKTSFFLPVFLFCVFLPICSGLAQSRLNPEVRVGLNCKLYNFEKWKKRAQRFPGIHAFATFMVNGNYEKWLHTSYSATLTIYNKSLGNNLNPLVSDVQIDFVNTLTLGAGWSMNQNRRFVNFEQNRVPYMKYMRTINNGPGYNLKHDFEYALLISSNFLLNNHRRNQTNGNITVTTEKFTLSYYNDGAPPVSWFSLADGFDRYWTGGVMMFFHTHKNRNAVEFSFDQFTGYTPLLYELAAKLGMNVPEYATSDHSKEHNGADIPLGIKYQSRFSSASYNSSAYNLRVFLNDDIALDAGILGSMMWGKNGNERHFGLQDIIHINGRYSLHPNRDINRFFLGMFYNQSIR